MKCKLCKTKLARGNKSGYCTKCYPKSPQYLEYQRNYQKEFYHKHKNGKKEHRNRPKTKKKIKDYHKKYQQEHKEELKKYKREWARKNRKLNKIERGKKMTNKKYEKKTKENRIGFIVVFLLVLGSAFIMAYFFEPEVEVEELTFRIEEAICKQVQVEIGRKLIETKQINCNKVIILSKEECEYTGYGSFCTQVYGSYEEAKCYEGSHLTDYPCDASYCEFGYTIVKDKKFIYTKENWQPIYGFEEQCEDVVVEKMVGEVTKNIDNLELEWLEANCEFIPDQIIDPWRCFDKYTVYIE